jgi:DnaJ domain
MPKRLNGSIIIIAKAGSARSSSGLSKQLKRNFPGTIATGTINQILELPGCRSHAKKLGKKTERGYRLTYQELQQARETLGLGERATLAQIKTRYRLLAKQHHPDGQPEPVGPEAIQRLNAAYALICNYCESYHYSFSQEEFFEQNPEERLRWQFATDPLWGRGERHEDEGEAE